jgi:Cu-Zn family superoxide dismutase
MERSAIVVFHGTIKGMIRFYQPSINEHCVVNVELEGCQPNHTFGCHVHKAGDLSDGCTSTCSHFNPFNKLHGRFEFHNKDRHVGDLAIPNGNLVSDKYGKVSMTFCDDLVSLYFSSPACIIGRAVVIHEKADDGGYYRNRVGQLATESGKTGNAGKRIACGVIGISA